MLQIVWVELLTQKQTNKKQNSPLRRDYYIYQCSVCIALFNRITRFKSKDHVRGNANTEFPLLYINLSVTVAFLSFEINSISFDTIRKGGNTQQTPDYILFFIVWETSSGEKNRDCQILKAYQFRRLWQNNEFSLSYTTNAYDY